MKTMLCLAAMLAVLGASAQDEQEVEAERLEKTAQEAAAAPEARLAEAQERRTERHQRRVQRRAAQEARLAEAQERLADAAEEVARIASERAQGRAGRHVSVYGPRQRAFRAFLGVLIAEQDENGIRVAGVSPDGGAEAAGVKADDVIVAIGEESLLGSARPLRLLHGVLKETKPGDSVEVVVLRDGEEHRFDVATTAFAEDSGLHWRWLDRLGNFDWPDTGWFRRDRDGVHLADVDRWRSGLELVDIGEDLGDYFGVDAGVLVLDTPAGSEFKPGDIVKRIAGAAVASSDDAYDLLESLEEDAEAEVRRNNRKAVVKVEPLHARLVEEVHIELDDD